MTRMGTIFCRKKAQMEHGIETLCRSMLDPGRRATAWTYPYAADRFNFRAVILYSPIICDRALYTWLWSDGLREKYASPR